MAVYFKSLERRIRRTVIRLMRPVSRTGSTSGSIRLPESPSILLLRHDRIGDALISTPIFALLREHYPSSRIDLLLGALNAAVSPLLSHVDGCLVLRPSFNSILQTLHTIRRRRYDIVINLLTKDSASGAMLSALSHGRIRIGFEGETSGAYDIVVPHPDQVIHIVRETSLLLAPLGIEPIGEEPRREAEHLQVDQATIESNRGDHILRSSLVSPPYDVRITVDRQPEPVEGCPVAPSTLRPAQGDDSYSTLESQKKKLEQVSRAEQHIVVINISGSGPEKFWGEEKIVALAVELSQMGLHPVIAGSPGDAPQIATIAYRSGGEALAPTRSFAEFASLLSQADMIVTPDTSIVHLAAALRKPTVMLVASELEVIPWSPWGTPHRVVRHKQRIREIQVEPVVNAVVSLAAETIRTTHSSPRA